MRKRKLLKILIGIFSVTAILIIGSGIYLKCLLPNIKVKDLRVKATAERVERGKYLANHVLVCVDCHSKRDWTKYSGPIVPGLSLIHISEPTRRTPTSYAALCLQ